MGRAIDQAQGAKLLHQTAALFEYARPERVHRQALALEHVDVAKKTDGVFASREPVRPLAKIAEQGRIHLSEKFFDKIRAEIGVVVKKSSVARTGPSFADIA